MMVRGFIKTSAAQALRWTGASKLAGILTGAESQPAIIGYHRVVEDFESSAANSIPSMLISRGMLENHLDWMGRYFRFVSLEELGARLVAGKKCGGLAAITFDDGYSD